MRPLFKSPNEKSAIMSSAGTDAQFCYLRRRPSPLAEQRKYVESSKVSLKSTKQAFASINEFFFEIEVQV